MAQETAIRPAAKKEAATGAGRGELARRRFVWFSVFGFLGACLAGTVRFFYPRALFEPKTRFVVGYPGDFGMGVSTKFQQSNRIWVVRDSSSIYVLFARCTHLGCTPDWSENKFKCPCHGSGFDIEGINFEGPAPRPLERVHVELDAEGRIIVDRAKRYQADQWKEPGAFLPV